jgi:hypothetical protein
LTSGEVALRQLKKAVTAALNTHTRYFEGTVRFAVPSCYGIGNGFKFRSRFDVA